MGLKDSVKIHVLQFKNTTARTGINAKKRNNEGNLHLDFSQFSDHEDGVVLEMAQRSCAPGHKVNLELLVSSPPQNWKISITGKVTDVSKSSGGKELITIQFIQFDKGMWKKILAHVDEKRDQIYNLFKSMKGLD